MIGQILGGAGTGGGKSNFDPGLIEDTRVYEQGIIAIFPDRRQAIQRADKAGDACFFYFFGDLKTLLNPIKNGSYLFFLDKFNGLEDVFIAMNRENDRQFAFNHR